MIDEALVDVVLSILEQADSPSSMLQDLYWFDVFVNIDSHKVAPDIRNHDDG